MVVADNEPTASNTPRATFMMRSLETCSLVLVMQEGIRTLLGVAVEGIDSHSAYLVEVETATPLAPEPLIELAATAFARQGWHAVVDDGHGGFLRHTAHPSGAMTCGGPGSEDAASLLAAAFYGPFDLAIAANALGPAAGGKRPSPWATRPVCGCGHRGHVLAKVVGLVK